MNVLWTLTSVTIVVEDDYDGEFRYDRLPGFHPRGIAAGLHLVLDIGLRALGEKELIARAEGHSLALDGLRPYWQEDGEGPPAVLLGYSAPAEHEYPATLAARRGALS